MAQVPDTNATTPDPEADAHEDDIDQEPHGKDALGKYDENGTAAEPTKWFHKGPCWAGPGKELPPSFQRFWND